MKNDSKPKETKRENEDVREEMYKSVIQLFAEGWNLKMTLQRIHLEDEIADCRLKNQIERFIRRTHTALQEMGMQAIDLTGKEYSPEFPVVALNLADFTKGDTLYIKSMKQPIVKMIGTEDILQTGIVVLDQRKEE